MKIELKPVAQILLIYLLSIILGTVVFVSLFWIEFFRSIDVLFFRSSTFLILTCLLLLLVLVPLKSKACFKLLTYRDIIIIIILFFFLNNTFYSYVPFNTSRSVSVMIVGHLYRHQNTLLSKQQIEAHIYQLYFKNEDAVHRRLKEQIELGNIEKVGEFYKLSPKGVRVVEVMGLVTSAYNTDKNYAR